MSAYYNEHDPKAAAWLRELIAEGHITPGEVDERSILEVRPHELTGFTQQHFFAGIGGWSLALRLSEWPDDRPVRSGSCPCQPFSQAGQRKGTKDERHLWPAFRDLITFGEPTITFGEQVGGPLGLDWLSGVRADLEGRGYEVGAANLPAACVGAPHIRQRLFWMANAHHGRASRHSCQREHQGGAESRPCGEAGRLAVPGSARAGRHARNGNGEEGSVRGKGNPDGNDADALGACGATRGMGVANGSGWHAGQPSGTTAGHRDSTESAGGAGWMGDSSGIRCERVSAGAGCDGEGSRGEGGNRAQRRPIMQSSGASNWSDFDILPCRDGKARRVESGTFPLAHGFSESLACVLSRQRIVWAEISAYAQTRQANPDEILRMVRLNIQQGKGWKESPTGVRVEFHAPALLLDLLLGAEAARDRATDECRSKKEGSKIIGRTMRILRRDSGALRSSCGRESEEQRPIESPASMHLLPFVLARHTEAYREEVIAAHAALNRIALLRGYGNAIVPQVAALFIQACEETLNS